MKRYTTQTLGFTAAALVMGLLTVFLIGCGDDEARQRAALRQRAESAERASNIWMAVAFATLVGAWIYTATRKRGSPGSSDPGQGGRRGPGPGTDTSVIPVAPSTATSQPPRGDAPKPQVPQMAEPPTAMPHSIGTNGASVNPLGRNGEAAAVIPIIVKAPATGLEPFAKPEHVIVDGLNVCLGGRATKDFRLQRLLQLLTEILHRGIGFECYFDASAPHKALRLGGEPQQHAYDHLLNEHENYFGEVPGGEPADATVLLRANTRSCHVITNDRFKKDTEQYRSKYPWLVGERRLIKGKQQGNRLVVTTLDIGVPIEPDLDTALQTFECALRDYEMRGRGEVVKAA